MLRRGHHRQREPVQVRVAGRGSVDVVTILVSGATGSVGGAVFTRLSEAGVDVRGGSRHPESAGLPAGTAVRFDLGDPTTFRAALDGVDAVFLYATGHALEPFLQAARAAGSPRVVLLSSASVVEPDADTSIIAVHHRGLEEAISAAGLPATFLRAGDFATNTLRWAPGIRTGGSVALPYTEARLAPIHELDIADVAVQALTGDGLIGRAPLLRGPDVRTQRDQVRALSRALGRSLQVEELTPDEARQQMGAFVPAPVVDTLLAFLASRVDTTVELTDEVEAITGHPARSFDVWARDHVDAFR